MLARVRSRLPPFRGLAAIGWLATVLGLVQGLWRMISFLSNAEYATQLAQRLWPYLKMAWEWPGTSIALSVVGLAILFVAPRPAPKPTSSGGVSELQGDGVLWHDVGRRGVSVIGPLCPTDRATLRYVDLSDVPPEFGNTLADDVDDDHLVGGGQGVLLCPECNQRYYLGHPDIPKEVAVSRGAVASRFAGLRRRAQVGQVNPKTDQIPARIRRDA